MYACVFTHLSSTMWFVTCPVAQGTRGPDTVLAMVTKTGGGLKVGEILQALDAKCRVYLIGRAFYTCAAEGEGVHKQN